MGKQKTTVVPEEARVQTVNDKPCRTGGRYVLYWMQQSMRAEHNPALEYAVRAGNEQGLPVAVCFGLMDDYPEANLRHYAFMLEGLRDVAETLKERKIPFALRHGHPADVALHCGKDAALIVCDVGYLRHQRQWRERVGEEAGCQVVTVEADVVVPVELASNKREHAARTIRPRIWKHAEDFLVELNPNDVEIPSPRLELPGKALDPFDVDGNLDSLKIDRSVGRVSHLFKGGTQEATRVFRDFLRKRFSQYAEHRNQPQTDDVSHMSKYLHFGQISPVWLILEARKHETADNEEAFVEELLIRRELAMNFVRFTPDYDAYSCIPDYAKETLAEHQKDKRPATYTEQELVEAETHDEYFNAAMREMRDTGYMHNYMRMYWGKKILEWSESPEQAFATALALNNRYFLDGRDANSFSNVAWVFGNHDHGWPTQPVFGKVRSMKASGLKRKTDPDAYIRKVDRLICRGQEEFGFSNGA